jgi:hypothetical protein
MRRSVWRELSFFIFVVKSNAVSLRNVVNGFAKINKLFLVEKRIKVRPMQLAKHLIS